MGLSRVHCQQHLVYSASPRVDFLQALHGSLELFTLKNRSLSALSARGLSLALIVSSVLIALTACGQRIYVIPQYSFAGRPVPPSLLQQRVMVSITNAGSGALEILDGLRDLRNNVPNTIPSFSIKGYSGGYPSLILNFPEQLRGYVYSNSQPVGVSVVNYSTESTSGSASGGASTSLAIAPDFIRIFSAAEQSGQIVVIDSHLGTAYALNLPNVSKVAVNRGDTVVLAMVRNSNALYRILKLNINSASPPGAIDCQPTILPVYCVVPVPGTFDRPVDATFSLDGSSAYVINCGQECGGGSNGGAGVSFIPEGSLQIDNYPTALPYPLVVTQTVPIPGGSTIALADPTNLYLAGQQLQPDGLYAGRLTTLNLTTMVPSAPVSISDGTHTRMLFADDNTLWIGSQFCATGERASLGQNYNCLTRYDLAAGSAAIVPAINAATANTAASVPYPNANNNLLYLGSLTGICWVQNYHKVYTAYGGQVHAFSTATGAEINNINITVQGTALDVAYMDALSNSAN